MRSQTLKVQFICGIAGAIIAGALAKQILNALFNLASRNQSPIPFDVDRLSIAAIAVLGFMLGLGFGLVLLRWLDAFKDRWGSMDSGDRVTVFLGIFVGLLATSPLVFLYNAYNATALSADPSAPRPPIAYVVVAICGLTLGFVALSVYALQSMGELLPWNKGVARGRRRGIKLLDTNVIIDGRVYDVARTGFLEGQLYVPGFVLDELQHIADSHDALRRQRGRRGLDVLRLLQADFPLEVRVHDRLVSDDTPVDTRLVLLAKALGGDIVTNDFNLNRVAAVQDVKVLNLNDLALSMRPNVLPKESLLLTVIREGNQPGQGVGYLEDGTMVVVENGREHIGETLDVTVTQVIQTERGKMIFAEFGEANAEDDPMQDRRKPRYRS